MQNRSQKLWQRNRDERSSYRRHLSAVMSDQISMNSCQISGTYEEQSLSSILDEWTALLNLRYTIEEDRVLISDLQCQ